MRKYALFLLLVSLFFIKAISHAQQKSMLSVSIGASRPLGNFAQKDSSSVLFLNSYDKIHNNAGFAKTGVNIALDYRYAFGKKWGALLKIKGQQNTCDNNALKNFYTESNTYSWANEIAVSTGKWLCGSVLGGAYYTLFSVGQKHTIDIQAKAMGGILKTSVPSSDATFLNSSTFRAEKNSFAKTNLKAGFAYLLGADLLYYFDKRIDFIGSIDYTGAFLKGAYYTVI